MPDDATISNKMKTTKTVNELLPDFGSWMDGSIRAWESWAQSNGTMIKGCSELAQEMLAFSHGRLQTDIDAWTTLTACQNARDFFKCQKEFTEKATAQYLEEANKLTTRVIGVMNGATASFREQISKS